MARNPKPSGKIGRKTETRTSKKSILIVCEGEKTEVEYIRQFCSLLKLQCLIAKKGLGIKDARVTIVPGDICGQAPNSIVKYAKKHHGFYDKVFCVFDTEIDSQHKSLGEAINLLSGLGNGVKNKIRGIISNPYFEYWLLLHFSEKRPTVCNKSAIESKLKEFHNSYDKNLDIQAFEKELGSNIILRAEELSIKYCKIEFGAMSLVEIKDSNQCCTNFHVLVNHLLSLKEVTI